MANCFVIMPFRPELGFFYRTLKEHVERAFPGVRVERGDDRVLTRPLLEKIADLIRDADVVIADCSGRNPNVFYELGLAHALDRQVVLVTSDPVTDAPTDVRAFEFISYATLTPDQFLIRLDNALQHVLGDPYAGLYAEATLLFAEFIQRIAQSLLPVAQNEFVELATAAHERGRTLAPGAGRQRAELLVRWMLGADPAIDVLVALRGWLDQKFPAPPGAIGQP